MLRSIITERIMDNEKTFDMGMFICHTQNLYDDILPNTQSLFDKHSRKWAYSGQSSFFVDKCPVT